ncbi:MFS transporter [Sphingomonas yantingensis]|uniref:GPH family glycoside/pentoside/hexuronide:cation symporter n=1 Tax=Sphingomonas yantingensis TaxID=1241761 RepID=A0A7W9ARZ3_9SPHN|nr:MFS transporter [Sphingomonas yantingensis]MBB5699274.1 GPH family glycoside/pentoside/hexuronide:cation symporter [Sphingomonas yantingensis]
MSGAIPDARSGDAHALPPVRRVATATTLAYGFGAVAYGVKDNGFGTFLLLFYNQVMGLPSAQVGFVVMCALLLDAVIDPMIGVASDRTRSRWGRRHPWMYAAALPIALGWVALWNPPALSSGWTLAWLFGAAVVVRTAVSAYEVPSQALTPELTADYDERTRITAYRYIFGWTGGLLMLLAAYQLFLVPEAGQTNGLLNREGYRGFAIAGAIAMFVAITVSAIGTHREIRRLPRPAIEPGGLGTAFRELASAMKNRPFLILMAAGLFAYTNQGISFALSNYLYTFVWKFETATFAWLAAVLFAGVVIAFVGAPALARTIGKPRAAASMIAAAGLLQATPFALRLAGIFPEPGEPAMLPILFAIYTLNTAVSVGTAILGASMMADVVEHSEVRTGKRSEGVFFAGAFFVQKCTSGIGIFVSGLILAAVGFPEGAKPGQVGADTLDWLTILFAGTYLVLSFSAAWLFLHFPFGAAEHRARVEALAASD